MSEREVEDWHGQATDDTTVSRASVTTARHGLVSAMEQLRYSGHVGSYRDTSFIESATETEFVTAVTTWLLRFATVLESVSDTAAEMSDELSRLRSQRNAVREFLGLI